MNLVILTEADRLDTQRFSVADHRAVHLGSVLKVGPGERVEIGLLNGPRGVATVEAFRGESVILKAQTWVEVANPLPEIDVICALPRPQTLKRVLLTSAMMGVRRLHLIRANRVERSYFQSPLVEPDQQLPYLIEGLSQGKLTRVPQVTIHERFRTFIEDTLPAVYGEDNAAIRLLADLDTSETLHQVLNTAPGLILLAIGPEGGWVPFETELMRKSGFRAFHLSRAVLRVETALTAALAQIELLVQMRRG